MEEIKNCPLCGADGEVKIAQHNDKYGYYVTCKKCLLRTMSFLVDDKHTDEQAFNQAVEVWNQRTNTAKHVKIRRVSRVKA